MRLSNKILLASTNRDKFEEFRSLFTAYPDIEVIPAEKIVRNPERLSFVERFDTYAENALAKARLANLGAHYPTLADDSGLEVEALGGKPGVRSHRFASPRPHMTQDEANVQYLLEQIKGAPHRGARFVATLVLLIEGITVQATGILDGTLINAPRGDNGFGYDPIFVPKGATKTLAEMTDSEKNAISHRAKALHELMAQVNGHGIVFAKP